MVFKWHLDTTVLSNSTEAQKEKAKMFTNMGTFLNEIPSLQMRLRSHHMCCGPELGCMELPECDAELCAVFHKVCYGKWTIGIYHFSLCIDRSESLFIKLQTEAKQHECEKDTFK